MGLRKLFLQNKILYLEGIALKWLTLITDDFSKVIFWVLTNGEKKRNYIWSSKIKVNGIVVIKNVNLASHSFICIAEKLVCTETFDYLTVANLAQPYMYQTSICSSSLMLAQILYCVTYHIIRRWKESSFNRTRASNSKSFLTRSEFLPAFVQRKNVKKRIGISVTS